MRLINSDCISAMREMADNSVDSIVTDPPYELTSGKNAKVGFMGKACVLEGFDFIGIDMTAEYIEIAKARIEFARTELEREADSREPELFDPQ